VAWALPIAARMLNSAIVARPEDVNGQAPIEPGEVRI
jgi:hypothetical protein